MKATKTPKRKRANDSANSINVEKSPSSSTPYVAATDTQTEDEWVDAEDSDSSLTTRPITYKEEQEIEFLSRILEQQLEERENRGGSETSARGTSETTSKKKNSRGQKENRALGRTSFLREPKTSSVHNNTRGTKIKSKHSLNPRKKTKMETKNNSVPVNQNEVMVVNDINDGSKEDSAAESNGPEPTSSALSRPLLLNGGESEHDLERGRGVAKRDETVETPAQRHPAVSEFIRDHRGRRPVDVGGQNGSNNHAVGAGFSNINQVRAIPMEKRKEIDGIIAKTVYVKSAGRELINYFRRQPFKLQKELSQAAGGEVARIQVAGGGLRILAHTERQRDRLMEIKSLDGQTVQTSLPYAITRRQSRLGQPINYGPRGVIHGLEEGEETLAEIASSIGLKALKRIGNPETSRTTMVTWPQGVEMSTHIKIGGRYFKVWPYIPRPRRCDRCQAFSHPTQSCKEGPICSRCSGPHPYLKCPNKEETPKCANCHQSHSAAYRKCEKYIETKQIIKEKIEARALYSEMVKKSSATAPSQEAAVALPPYQDETIQEFVNVDNDKYQATIVSTNEGSGDHPDLDMLKKTSFVLGVLALLDSNKAPSEMQEIVATSSSEILFDGRVRFKYNTERI